MVPDARLVADDATVDPEGELVLSVRAADGWTLLTPAAGGWVFSAMPPAQATLELARASGILAPGTAYIVVENSAQWRALERAEEKSLGARGALEFDEFITPEPEVWLVLAGFLAWWGWRQRRSSGAPRGLGAP